MNLSASEERLIPGQRSYFPARTWPRGNIVFYRLFANKTVDS